MLPALIELAGAARETRAKFSHSQRAQIPQSAIDSNDDADHLAALDNA
jgi:hypothetical protein